MGRHRHARPKKITYALLHKWGACSHDRYEFSAEFPNGAEATFETVLKCVQRCLDIDWFVQQITTNDQYKIYLKARYRAEKRHGVRRSKVRNRVVSWKRTEKNKKRISNLMKEEFFRWEKAQARLFMRVWKGTLIAKKP